MALSKVALFCAGLEAQMQEAVQQAGAIGIEATLLAGLREDVAEQIKQLRDELPAEDFHVKETSSDVVYLQNRAESLQAESRRLRQALATHRAAHGELMRRLALRDMVLEGMRAASLRKQEHSFPMELYDKIELQLTQAREGFATELEAAEKRHAASSARVEQRLRKIIDAKEKEIIQLQLHFDQALRAAHGSKAQDVRSAVTEVERAKATAHAAMQKAQLDFETRMLEAVTKERVAADLRLRDALSLKDAEIRYLKTALDEQGNSNKALDDMCRNLQSTVDAKTTWLSHVTTVELPYAVRTAVEKVKSQMTSQIMTAKASTVAAQTERDSALASVEAMKAQLAAGVKERDALQTQIVGLRSDLVTKDGAIRETTALRNASLTEISNLKAELDDMRQEVSMMRRLTASGSNMSADFMERIDALREQLKEAQRSAEEESKTSQREIEQYAKALASAQEKVFAAEQESARLRRALELAQAEMASLQHEMETLKNSKAKLESTVVSQRLQAAAANTASIRRTSSATGMTASSPAAMASRNSPIDHRSTSPINTLDTSTTQVAHGKTTPRGTPRMVTGATPNMSAVDSGVMQSAPSLGESFRSPKAQQQQQHQLQRSTAFATREASVQCLLLDLPLNEKISVRAGTAIGRDTARLEARLANAILRDDLARYRFMLDLQRTSDGEDFIEREPVPVTTSLDVRRQNTAMEVELTRRKALAGLRRGQETSLNSFVDNSTSRRDPIVELLMAAARDVKLHSTSPDDNYVMADVVAPVPQATSAASHFPRPSVAESDNNMDGPFVVHMTLSSARGVQQRPGVKFSSTGTAATPRPMSAGMRRTTSPRSASAAGETVPRVPTADIIDPVGYFTVNNRCREAVALAADGVKATITPSPRHPSPPKQQRQPPPDPVPEHGAPPAASAVQNNEAEVDEGYSRWESASPRARDPTIALRSYGASFTTPRPPSAPSSRPQSATALSAQQVIKRRFDDAVEARRREAKRQTWTKGSAPLRASYSAPTGM